MEPSELTAVYQRLARLPEPPKLARLGKEDWLGALGVLLLVFLSTLPVVIPFVFMQEIAPALRLSNIVAITMLAIAGVAFGRITGRKPDATQPSPPLAAAPGTTPPRAAALFAARGTPPPRGGLRVFVGTTAPFAFNHR